MHQSMEGGDRGVGSTWRSTVTRVRRRWAGAGRDTPPGHTNRQCCSMEPTHEPMRQDSRVHEC